tara:strand:+ start:1209 stop:1838 length:630 start_codon:yes stop_codon:yes gene_type:complete
MSKRKTIRCEPRFEFLPQEKWKKLSKEERSILGSYKTNYRWVMNWKDKIDQKNKEIKELKDKIDRKLYDMNELNGEIDHLRENYDFSISFINQNKHTNKKTGITTRYWSVNLTFRGNEKTTRLFPLGSEDKIRTHMLKYFKSNPMFKKSYDKFKTRLTKKFKEFMVEECKMGEIYEICMDTNLDNPKGFRNGSDDTKLTLDDFYPISTK